MGKRVDKEDFMVEKANARFFFFLKISMKLKRKEKTKGGSDFNWRH